MVRNGIPREQQAGPEGGSGLSCTGASAGCARTQPGAQGSLGRGCCGAALGSAGHLRARGLSAGKSSAGITESE